MNDSPEQRQAILDEVAEQLRPILEGSAQSMYVFFDEQHKFCNERFAQLLGYDSAAAWDQDGPFTDLYVAPRSQHDLVSTYRAAMEQGVGSTVEVSWKRRDGSTVPTRVILVPFACRGALMALHYITPLEA